MRKREFKKQTLRDRADHAVNLGNGLLVLGVVCREEIVKSVGGKAWTVVFVARRVLGVE